MTRLHFHPIQGQALDIISAILHTGEMAAVGDALRGIRLVVEELVVNIVDYAGSDYLDVEVMREEEHITFRFRDGGMPFNPLEHQSPGVSLPIDQRTMGGLGILLVLREADCMAYEYSDGENVLTVALQTNKTTSC